MKNKYLYLVLLAIVIAGGSFFVLKEDVKSSPNYIFKPAPKKGVIAKFSGIEVTEDEFEKGIETELYEAQLKIYELKMEKLQSLIVKILIQQDPKGKDLTEEEYLEKFVTKDKGPSNNDIENFIKERKIPSVHVNDQLKERIKKYLEMDSKRQAVMSWLAEVTTKKPVEVYFEKPARPVFNVDVGDAPFYGPADAKVTFIEFSEFECPACSRASKTVKELKEKYKGKVKFVMKHFPLSFHHNAKKAAEASMCAHEQKKEKFWDLYYMMFDDQASLGVDDLKAKAKKMGLNEKAFNKCLDDGKFADYVGKDMKQGEELGLKATPTFFINGKIVSGAVGLDDFSEIIDEELKM